jgi:hypothetical protein
MKPLILLFALFGLSACVNHIADVDSAKYTSNDAFLVLDTDITFDGKQHALCDLSHGVGAEPAGMERVAFESDPRLMIMKVTPGKYALGNVSCHAYKVLWNKVRVKNISPPLMVNVAPGTVTYPGTVVGTWDSEGMAAKDLFNGGGTWTQDEGSLTPSNVKTAPRKFLAGSRVRIHNG